MFDNFTVRGALGVRSSVATKLIATICLASLHNKKWENKEKKMPLNGRFSKYFIETIHLNYR